MSANPSSPVSLGAVRGLLETWWPAEDALDWDATGLVVGHPRREIHRIRLVVDVVADTVEEAIADGIDLIIAHHPLLLRGVTQLSEERYKGALIAKLIRADISLLTAHTNADAAQLGTSEVLAKALGMTALAPISAGPAPGRGIGRVGTLPEPTRLYDLATRLGGLLPQTAGGLRISGDAEAMVRSVALCTGSGDSLLSEKSVQGADVYITADLRHHPASEAQQQRLLEGGPALIDMSHFASEWFFLSAVCESLRAALPGVDVSVSEVVTDPWDFVIHPGSPTA